MEEKTGGKNNNNNMVLGEGLVRKRGKETVKDKKSNQQTENIIGFTTK